MKKMKKLLLLTAVIITALVCFVLSASALEPTGQCGDDVYWTYSPKTQELVISGNGPMWNYVYDYSFFDYGEIDIIYSSSPFDDIKKVSFEGNITTIGEGTFLACDNIESIVIPSSVTSIGFAAFYGCAALKNVTLSEGLTKIGRAAFYHCNNLERINIPDSVTTIVGHAFGHCDNLKNITLPDSLESIGEYAFVFSGLASIKLPENLTEIGNGAFSSCDFKNITIPKNVSNMGSYVFGNCDKLTDITIADGVTVISKELIAYCDNIKSITIPDGVVTIGDGAFIGCKGLINVVMSDSITTIGKNAFSNCKSLKYIIIGNGVKTIDERAFYECDALTSVTIPESVTAIKSSAFSECINITDVYYTGTEEQWSEVAVSQGNGYLNIANVHYNSCSHQSRTVISKRDPTCIDNGYTEGLCCSDCGMVLYGREKIKAKGHSFTEKIIDTKHLKSKATVESAAVYKYDCSKCDAISSKNFYSHGKALALGTSTKITATSDSSSITLVWNKAKNANGYRLYYKLPGDFKWREFINYITATTATFKNLPAGQKYSFAVRSVYKRTNGSYILGGYKEIETATEATAPSKVLATQNATSIKLDWNVCAGATGYRIYYKSGSSWKICVNSTILNAHNFQNLKAGTKFTFAIRPYIKTASGVIWSDYITYTAATKPANPTSKIVSNVDGKISLSFSSVNGADSYQVYYKTGTGAYTLYKTYTKAGTLKFTDLKPGVKYTFAVRACIKTSGGIIRSGYKETSVTVK